MTDVDVKMPLVYTLYHVASKAYLRRASVVMACVSFNATQRKTDEHYLIATWQRRWWGGYRLKLEERWPTP